MDHQWRMRDWAVITEEREMMDFQRRLNSDCQWREKEDQLSPGAHQAAAAAWIYICKEWSWRYDWYTNCLRSISWVSSSLYRPPVSSTQDEWPCMHSVSLYTALWGPTDCLYCTTYARASTVHRSFLICVTQVYQFHINPNTLQTAWWLAWAFPHHHHTSTSHSAYPSHIPFPITPAPTFKVFEELSLLCKVPMLKAVASLMP